jgi:ABC-type uncharacterized transport system substrate-binding protein
MRVAVSAGLAMLALGTALGAAAGSTEATVARVAAAPSERVMVLTRDPSVRAEVEKSLRAWRASRNDVADITVDQRLLQPQESERDLVAAALAGSNRYRAVLATTMALARAVQEADPRVPVIFRGAADPVVLCLVDSPQRPGRSATGFTNYLPSEGTKMLEALLDGFPAVRRVYFVVGGDNVEPVGCSTGSRANAAIDPGAEQPICRAGPHALGPYIARRMNEYAGVEAARRRNVDARFLLLCEPDDYSLLRSIDSHRDDIGYLFPWQFMHTGREQQIVDLVSATRRPAVYGRTRFAELGGLMAIETLRDPGDERRAIDMLIQVLDGRPPATLPVQMPRGFRLTVNAAAAADMQLRPSLSLLRRADNIIVRKSTNR